MEHLEHALPDPFSHFIEGLHSVRVGRLAKRRGDDAKCSFFVFAWDVLPHRLQAKWNLPRAGIDQGPDAGATQV